MLDAKFKPVKEEALSHVILGGHGDSKGIQRWVKDAKSWCKLKKDEKKKKK